MIVIVGYVVAMGCIFGVYIFHGGNIGVILTALPFELITIFGGALGAFAVNNQPKVLKAVIKLIPQALRPLGLACIHRPLASLIESLRPIGNIDNVPVRLFHIPNGSAHNLLARRHVLQRLRR